MISPREPRVTIGLEDHVVRRLRTRVELPVDAYRAPPRIEVRGGRTFVESVRLAGTMIEAAGIAWHGHFEETPCTRIVEYADLP